MRDLSVEGLTNQIAGKVRIFPRTFDTRCVLLRVIFGSCDFLICFGSLAVDFSTTSGMESTPKIPWSRKRKLQAKMERLRKAKLAKSDSSTSPDAPPEPTTPETPGESSETPLPGTSGTSGVHEPDVSAESLDDVPVTAQLSEDDSSESDEDSVNFSNDDARQLYQEWLKEQPKHNIKMMAVMFMDSLIDRFNMTTRGAANEVGLVLKFVPGVRISTPTRVTSLNQGRENTPDSSFWMMKVCGTRQQSG